MTLSIKDSKIAEYEQLIADLRDEVKHNEEIMGRVEDKIKSFEQEIKRLHMKNLEIQDNCDKLFDEKVEKDRQVENWKHRYKLISDDYEQLDKQNKTMRELIKQWA